MSVLEQAKELDWVNAGSGLLGVFLGAALTYIATYQFERRRDHKAQRGSAYNLLFAVLRIADDLTKMELDLRNAIAKAEMTGAQGEIWTTMTSSIGYADPVSIPASDLALIALTRDTALTTEIGESEAAHRIFLQSLSRLEALREKLDSFGLQTRIDGQIVSFEANEAQLARIGPTLIQLRTLSNSIAEGLPKAAAKARSVAERLGPHLKKHYKFKHFMSLSFPASEDEDGPVVSES
jgi:hypothetical protein